ncbi:MAG TPA: ornithine carbamoyltransferase [Gemmatales bacterium]|nr:ornithine carbamoyltransferase [Gemmatales bacterium]
MPPRHFLDLLDWDAQRLNALFDRASQLKADQHPQRQPLPLAGRVLGLVFEKPSLRTRVSFQAAIAQLGGSSIYLSGAESGMGTRETVADFARVISQYVDALVLRTFQHRLVEEFAAVARCPVINGLSDYYHPCQAVSDFFTLRERFGALAGLTLLFLGDGNNMARSLAIGCALLGLTFLHSGPARYGFDDEFLNLFAQRFPHLPAPKIAPLAESLPRADAVYTDVWTSMGQEAEHQVRLKAFAPFQLNAKSAARMKPEAVVLHCLPAHRGEEITGDVLEGPRSLVFAQAGNRLHVQKALLLELCDHGV